MAGRTLLFLGLITNLLLLSPGCSVKEERESCPAVIHLILPPGKGSVYTYFKEPSGKPDAFFANLEDGSSAISFPVSRSAFLLTVSSEQFIDSVFTIPYGCQSPELYLYTARLKIIGEEATITPGFCKEYCALDVAFSAESSGMKLRIRGKWNGQKCDRTLLEGPFETDIRNGETVNIPRQGDNSLMLDVMSGTGVLLRSFAIGEYMAAIGYDWAASSLQDLSVTIDFAESRLTLRGEAWEIIYPIKIDL